MALLSNSYISRVVYHAAGSARTGAFLPGSTEGFGCVLVLRKLNMFVSLKEFVRFMADDGYE